VAGAPWSVGALPRRRRAATAVRLTTRTAACGARYCRCGLLPWRGGGRGGAATLARRRSPACAAWPDGGCAPRNRPIGCVLSANGPGWWHASASPAIEGRADGGIIGRRVDRRAGSRHRSPPSATGAHASAAAGMSGGQRSRGESPGPPEGRPQPCGGGGSPTAAARCDRAPTAGAAGECVRRRVWGGTPRRPSGSRSCRPVWLTTWARGTPEGRWW